MKPSQRFRLHRLAEVLVTPERFRKGWTVHVTITAKDHASEELARAAHEIGQSLRRRSR